MKPSILRSLFCTALGTALTLAPITTMADPATEKGEAFLKENGTKDGVKTTPTGLQYKIVKEGTGKSPKATDTVLVHYRGTLLDGTEFDSSYKRNEPAEFPLSRVIPCWTEGVQRMKVGGKSRLVCPSEIAYGEAGSPPVIPGGATLVFEIELLAIPGR